MAVTDPGIVGWANGVRMTMASDSARQVFAEQIQTQGFDFLDDYLHNILNTPQQNDSIIDLVKTPSRKRVAKKLHGQGSKLKTVLSLAQEDEDEGGSMNSFTKALREAKSQDRNTPEQAGSFQPPVQPLKQPSPPVIVIPTASVIEPAMDEPMHSDTEMLDDPNNLSVIAEDEELPDRGRSSVTRISPAPQVVKSSATERLALPASTLPSRPNRGSTSSSFSRALTERETRRSVEKPALPVVEPDEEEQDMSVDMDLTGSFPLPPQTSLPAKPVSPLPLPVVEAAIESDHEGEGDMSVDMDPVSSPEHPHMRLPASSPAEPARVSSPKAAEHPRTPSPSPPPVVQTTTTAMGTYQDGITPLQDSPAVPIVRPASRPLQEYHTEPLPYMTPGGSRDHQDAMTAPLPAQAPRTSQFPTFTTDLALRQSIRAKEVATPGPPLGKRTSWLQQARQVQQQAKLEETGKRMSAVPGMRSIPPFVGAHKRKSGDMFGPSSVAVDNEEEERKHKMAKIFSQPTEPAPAPKLVPAAREAERCLEKENGASMPRLVRQPSPQAPLVLPLQNFPPIKVAETVPPVEEGFMDRFKRTVGFGAKSATSKSYGGAAATALAEARAAAEATVAQREMGKQSGPSDASMFMDQSVNVSVVESYSDPDRRMSMSDIMRSTEDAGDESTSTTPPDSPPALPSKPSSFIRAPPGPVFQRPPPKDKEQLEVKETKPAPVFSLPKKVFSLPPPSAMGLPTSLPPMAKKPPLTSHSTVSSMASERIFDADGGPAWMPSTQDTEYSAFNSQSAATLDDDDSWPLEERMKAAADRNWPGSDDREESMGWSTTGPLRGDTAATTKSDSSREATAPSPPGGVDGGDNDEDEDVEMDAEEAAAWGENELEEIETRQLAAATRAVTRSDSQMSMASTSSSQSQVGFVKYVGSLLGGGKKAKPDSKTGVKSIEHAAAAAKKQQEQDERNAARAKELKNVRELANQRNAEKEKIRQQEEDRKIKEDRERRKQQQAEKKPLKVLPKKTAEDDTMHKKKMAVEAEKKAEVKRPVPAKAKEMYTPQATSSRIIKPTPSVSNLKAPAKSAMKQAVSSSSLYTPGAASGSSLKMTESKSIKKLTSIVSSAATTTKGKGKAKAAPPPEDDITQPSQALQAQMAARAKAQLKAANVPTEPTSESIELPEIHSEYSDSDDEDRPRTFDPPDWAQSPELRQALHGQATINPDDIFGEIKPLKMEEVFKTRTTKFRARTSSANWTGADRLTAEEERDYAKRMGFR